MDPALYGRDTIDIPATVKKHKGTILTNILQLHAITGCDTVAQTYGIGKPTAISALEKGHVSLSKF